jgi:hypothetical protein
MEWIAVEDRLPIDEGKVLICFGEPFFGKRTDEIECGYYDEESETWKFWMSDKKVVGYGVHHWSILPDYPPKED